MRHATVCPPTGRPRGSQSFPPLMIQVLARALTYMSPSSHRNRCHKQAPLTIVSWCRRCFAQIFREEGGGGEHDCLGDRAARHEAPAGEGHRDRSCGEWTGCGKTFKGSSALLRLVVSCCLLLLLLLLLRYRCRLCLWLVATAHFLQEPLEFITTFPSPPTSFRAPLQFQYMV